MRDLAKLLPRADRGPAAPTWFVAAVELLLATFREIFDESAYARFLVRREIVSSRQAYAEFLRERAGESERRARCC